jgi:hypothetical protein
MEAVCFSKMLESAVFTWCQEFSTSEHCHSFCNIIKIIGFLCVIKVGPYLEGPLSILIPLYNA